jgi:hemerythrin-like domain-containing protein
MYTTAQFREEHATLIYSIDEIDHLLHEDPAASAGEIRDLLSSMAALLRAHLAAEDRVLYPELALHPEPALQALTCELQAETGGLKRAFEDYLYRWPTAESIAAHAGIFHQQTEALFAALRHRIDRENNQLFPLADALELDVVR